MPTAEALRKNWVERTRFPIEPLMTLSDAGLVLGAGTVLARRQGDAGPALAIAGSEERILALLGVAYGRAADRRVLDRLHRASDAHARGETTLALIHLAQTGLPKIDGEKAAYRLFLAEALLSEGMAPRELLRGCGLDDSGLDAAKAGFNPDEPRVPAGNPDGGQWTDGETEAPGAVPATARRPQSRGGDPDRFFDTVYDKLHALAQRLGINETWLLGLAAHESWYLEQHNRALNNPFGVTHGGGSNVAYDSIDSAIAYWEKRFGPAVQGAASAEDFVQRLYADHYNVQDPEWRQKVIDVIRSIPRRLSAWQTRRSGI